MMIAIGVAGFAVGLLTFAFGNGIVLRWIESRSVKQVEISALYGRRLEQLPGVGDVVKIEIVLDNFSSPQAELHNVNGVVWTSTSHLVATVKQPGVLYHERQAGTQKQLPFQFPVLSKLASSWLPGFMYRPPAAGEEILFGASVVSAETDYRQYRWKIVNRNGTPAMIIIDPGSPFPSQRNPLSRRIWWFLRGLW